ncbi:tRNA methyltransferase complex GCD14 subunit-domain-containing protein [Crassisporium funariophilum]|nr:tRNA methyltransferase complex GCD14 subunit-domain-containing protein [Crassisporium funariophilum]
MWSTAREVAAGDTVIIWLTRDLIQPLVVVPGKDFNTKYGNFRQTDFIGVPYGSKVPSRTGRGFLHILRPTPELWTIALPHRTQILYLADIAFITSCLNIRKGSRVIEAGTGSASFSHSVARTIGSSGHLWSYEFHEARFGKAKEEFTRHGMDDIVTLQHRNVCKDGFTVIDEADAVFLDLPAPWDAVEHARKALRKDRTTRICCFSPCMEQVLRTVNALNEAGFTEITMYETLLRPIEVFQVPALQSIAAISEKLKKSEQKREDKRLRQIAANKAAASAKRKRADDEDAELEDDNSDPTEILEDLGESSNSSKRVKTDEDGSLNRNEDDMDVSGDPMAVAEASSSLPTPLAPSPVPTPLHAKMNVSKALPEIRGHTSYLTFACLIPRPAPAAQSPESPTETAS